jgi:hypothetical protein
VPFSNNPVALEQGLLSLDTSIGTRIDLGLAEANSIIAAGAREDANVGLILLTDGGQQEASDRILAEAWRLKLRGVNVFTIGLGDWVDDDLLRMVASAPHQYFPAAQPADLALIYWQIAIQLVCP